MRRLRSVDDLGQQGAPRAEAERLDHAVVVTPRAKIAKGEARLRGIRRANPCQFQIEPILAMQRNLGAIEQIRRRRVHQGELRPLLTGGEPGARRLEAGAVRRRLPQPPHRLRGACVEPQPGVADRPVVLADEPSSVALTGHRDGRGALSEAFHLGAEIAQRLSAIRPGLVKRLQRRAVRPRLIGVRRRSCGDLPPRGVEGDRLDHRGPGVDANQDIASNGRHRRPPNRSDRACRPDRSIQQIQKRCGEPASSGPSQRCFRSAETTLPCP